MLPESSFSLLSFLFILFLFVPSSLSQENEHFALCAPIRCGRMPAENTTYPFWFDDQPDYCGHPKFKLECNDDYTTINISSGISSERFGVERIDRVGGALTLIDEDLASETCTTPTSNTTIDPSVFNFSNQDLHLTLYYNCPTVISLDNLWFHPMPCTPNLPGTYAFFTILTIPNTSFAYCQTAAITVLNSTEVTQLADRPLSVEEVRRRFRDAVLRGFEVIWEIDIDWCEGCRQSAGRCGYNSADPEQHVCICRNGTRQDNCAGSIIRLGERSNNKSKVIIGASIGAAVGFILLFLFLFFFCRRIQKKIPSFSSSKPSLIVSTDPYSRSELGRGVDTQLFSYKELEEATNNFDASKELGDGGFGTVYHGKLQDGRAVAVKRLFENNYKRVEQFKNEIKILSRLRHPSLVTLYGCCSRHSPELLLVYEYVPNGTVADHLHGDFAKPGALGLPTRLAIALETADALAYLHKVEIIHRDVKTSNILLDKNFRVKVADFGLSRLFPFDATHISTVPQGTPGYVDPEYHRFYQLTYKSDVYSFGVVLIELISSVPAVDITRHQNEINLASLAINRIQNDSLHELVDPTLGFNSDFAARKSITAVAELAFRCLQEEKESRPTMEEVLEVLREIENQEYKTVVIEEAATIADDSALLKGRMPPSPDTVTAAWISRNTTPSTSG